MTTGWRSKVKVRFSLGCCTFHGEEIPCLSRQSSFCTWYCLYTDVLSFSQVLCDGENWSKLIPDQTLDKRSFPASLSSGVWMCGCVRDVCYGVKGQRVNSGPGWLEGGQLLLSHCWMRREWDRWHARRTLAPAARCICPDSLFRSDREQMLLFIAKL